MLCCTVAPPLQPEANESAAIWTQRSEPWAMIHCAAKRRQSTPDTPHAGSQSDYLLPCDICSLWACSQSLQSGGGQHLLRTQHLTC